MDLWSYIYPAETFARTVISIQCLLFIGWLFLLFYFGVKKHQVLSRIKECENVDNLRVFILNKSSSDESRQVSFGNTLPAKARAFFDQYCENKVKDSSPLYNHLKAIFTAGYTESQVHIDALISNTANRLSSSNSALRSVLSLFIILGLFGTLIGLAESLSQLSSVSLGDAEFGNESLKAGLETLLGKLGGAFAPSIWGVGLTFLGILIFAIYLRLSTYPVLQRLEYETVTNWFPNLIPTPSQRVYEKLRLTEETAQNVEKLIETVQANTGELAKNIEAANSALSLLDEAAHNIAGSYGNLNRFADNFANNLNKFADRFQKSVETLTPFSDSLTKLYVKMTDESAEFQRSVKQTLEDSQEFRAQVNEQFDRQSTQSQQMLESLKLYETAYLESRQTTDEKISETLAAAESALLNLARQNEEFVNGLIKAVGDPLRKELVVKLGEVSTRSNAKLEEITNSSNSKLDEFSQKVEEAFTAVSKNVELVAAKLQTIEIPIKNTVEAMDKSAARTFQSADNTIQYINTRNDRWLDKLCQEFNNQNTIHEEQITKLVDLNTGIKNLTVGLRSLSEELAAVNSRANGSHGDSTNEPPSPQTPGFFGRMFNKGK